MNVENIKDMNDRNGENLGNTEKRRSAGAPAWVSYVSAGVSLIAVIITATNYFVQDGRWTQLNYPDLQMTSVKFESFFDFASDKIPQFDYPAFFSFGQKRIEIYNTFVLLDNSENEIANTGQYYMYKEVVDVAKKMKLESYTVGEKYKVVVGLQNTGKTEATDITVTNSFRFPRGYLNQEMAPIIQKYRT